MPFTLPKLPYVIDALEPHISARALHFHHSEHHKTYVANLNRLTRGTHMEGSSLETIIRTSATDRRREQLFNNAAQAWNHTFYWHSMKPGGGGRPDGELAKQIREDFGGFENLAGNLKDAGTSVFGSGWAWLVLEDEKLKVIRTANADTPAAKDQVAMLGIDVWEHAYYLDYQHRRAEYVSMFLERLVNWEFAAENFTRAKDVYHDRVP